MTDKDLEHLSMYCLFADDIVLFTTQSQIDKMYNYSETWGLKMDVYRTT
jgi:hypothetical protein